MEFWLPDHRGGGGARRGDRRQNDRAHVFLAAGRVVVVTTRCCPFSAPYKRVYRFSSPDGAATFDAGVAIGTVGTDDAVLGSAGVAMLSFGALSGSEPIFEVAPLDGPFTDLELHPSPGTYTLVVGQTLGLAPDGRPVAAWSRPIPAARRTS